MRVGRAERITHIDSPKRRRQFPLFTAPLPYYVPRLTRP